MDLRGFQRFRKGERRQDSGHALGQHRLAGTGRPDHQQVVATRRGDFNGPLRRLLPPHVAKVHRKLLRRFQKRPGVNPDWDNAVAGVEKLHNFNQRVHRININALHQGGFPRIHLGNDQLTNVVRARGDCDRQCAADATHSAVERQLTHEERIFGWLIVQSSVSAKNAERHGKVKARALFANVRGSKIDRGGRGWNVVAAVFQRRADALAALAHRGIWKPDRGERVVLGLDGSNIHLDLYEAGVDAVYCGAKRFIEHARERTPTTWLHITDFVRERCDMTHLVM